MEENELLRDLFHRRWAMPTLAVLHRWKGAKFVTLHKKLGASAGSMRTTIDELIERGLVMKNPGYGHPMRPEYVLSERGEGTGACCDQLLRVIDSFDARKLALSKWSMPVLFAITPGNGRFGEIRAHCPGITDRALTQALKGLKSSRLIHREVTESYPPSVDYSLTPEGLLLLPFIESLAQNLKEIDLIHELS